MMIREFAQVITPLSPVEFFSSKWGNEFVHLRGQADRFGDLLPWSALNRLLSQHRLEPPRLRLALGGHVLPPETYLRYGEGSPGVRVPRIVPDALNQQLRNGATLVLDAVDELYEPVTHLAEAFERALRERIQVNAYGSWGSTHGFDLHWDDHEVFILQVSGRKHWQVYGMARPYPLRRDSDPNLLPPASRIWSEVLDAGDVLYIPRGCWHVAEAMNEPSLHLTVGVSARTGVNFVEWLKDKALDDELFRMNLPQFATSEEQTAHMQRMKSHFVELWTADAMHRYLQEYDATTLPKRFGGLPWSASGDGVVPDDARFALNTQRPITLAVESDEVVFTCHGKTWRFARAATPMLNRLRTGTGTSVAELVDVTEGVVGRTEVRSFVQELLARGLLRLTQDAE